MHISRVQIKNFRNLKDFDIDLSSKVVLLGENGSGKSNFFEALRLALDSSYRPQLTDNDFSSGTTRFKGTKIEVHVWFSVLKTDDSSLIASVHDCIISEDVNTLEAKLSFVFRPRQDVNDNDALGEEQYEILRYGRDVQTNSKGAANFRKYIKFILIPAIRDMDRDMQSWRLSPMRRMVEVMGLANDRDFKEVANQVKSASDLLQTIAPIQQLQKEIRDTLGELIEDNGILTPEIGLIPTNPDDLQKILTLFGELDLPIVRSSLGLSNILYTERKTKHSMI